MSDFTEEDVKIFDKKILELCKTDIIRFTCQFFSKGKNGMEPFGSGVFTKSEEKHFILTASHVAEFLENEDQTLYIKVDHNSYINVIGYIHQTEIEKSKDVDLAIIRLDQEMLEPLSRPYFFLPINKFRKHDKLSQSPNYAVVGFPAVNIKYDKEHRETGATTYITSPVKEKVYKFYDLDPKNFYVLKMEGKGTNLTDAEKTKINDKFHGISGCGLWLIFTYKDGEEHKVDYRLIGIMTEFRKGKFYCLIGNKIQLVVDALNSLEGLKIQTAHNIG